MKLAAIGAVSTLGTAVQTFLGWYPLSAKTDTWTLANPTASDWTTDQASTPNWAEQAPGTVIWTPQGPQFVLDESVLDEGDEI